MALAIRGFSRFEARNGARRLPFLVAAAVIGMAVAVPLGIHVGSAAPVQASARPGAWTQVGPAQGYSSAALLHVKGGNDLVVWMLPVTATNHHYDAVELKPKGGMATKAVDVFGGHNWGSLTVSPWLVSQNGSPLLIFEGTQDTNPHNPYSNGCIVGDLRSSGSWKLQTWSLAQHCIDDHFGAAISGSTLSAAWPDGPDMLYRIGSSAAIPATSADSRITIGGDYTGSAAETADTASHNFYAAWVQFDSKPASKDGIWAADLSKNPKPFRAPGSGTSTVQNMPEPVAVASPAGRGGVYLAYCNDVSPCSQVELWKYGSASSRPVPNSSGARAIALSAGPSGRLWVAWWNAINGTVSVVRTNEAGSAFGPVKTFAGPPGCKGDATATITISSGTQQRLDVLLTCYANTANAATHLSATQSLVPLQIAASAAAVNHKTGGVVTYRVSDVGDPVAGATVVVDGKKGRTSRKGQVSFRFPKGARVGSFRVVASMSNYLKASTGLRIT